MIRFYAIDKYRILHNCRVDKTLCAILTDSALNTLVSLYKIHPKFWEIVLIEAAKDLGKRFMFQQENTPKHTAKYNGMI